MFSAYTFPPTPSFKGPTTPMVYYGNLCTTDGIRCWTPKANKTPSMSGYSNLMSSQQQQQQQHSASEMTCIVSSGALNSTHSLSILVASIFFNLRPVYDILHHKYVYIADDSKMHYPAAHYVIFAHPSVVTERQRSQPTSKFV